MTSTGADQAKSRGRQSVCPSHHQSLLYLRTALLEKSQLFKKCMALHHIEDHAASAKGSPFDCEINMLLVHRTGCVSLSAAPLLLFRWAGGGQELC